MFKASPAHLPKTTTFPKEKSVDFKKAFPYGVDIGSTAIKGICLAPAQEGLSVIDVIHQNINYGLAPADQEGFVLNFLKENFRQKTNIISALSNKQTQISVYRLPKMPDSEIENALTWKMRQQGVNIDEVNFDYCMLDWGAEAAGDNIEILTIVASRKDVESYNAIFKKANLNTRALDAMATAIVECLLYNGQIPRKGTHIVIEMGATTTVLILVVDGQLCFVRDLQVTGNFMTQAVVNYFNLDFANAEKIKKKFGIRMDVDGEKTDLNIDASQIKNAFIPVITDFFADIGYTFKYFSHQLTRSSVSKYDKVILSGGACKLIGMRDFLEDSLKTPVEIANPFRTVNIDSSLRNKNIDLVDVAPCFTVAMGLALYNITK